MDRLLAAAILSLLLILPQISPPSLALAQELLTTREARGEDLVYVYSSSTHRVADLDAACDSPNAWVITWSEVPAGGANYSVWIAWSRDDGAAFATSLVDNSPQIFRIPRVQILKRTSNITTENIDVLLVYGLWDDVIGVYTVSAIPYVAVPGAVHQPQLAVKLTPNPPEQSPGQLHFDIACSGTNCLLFFAQPANYSGYNVYLSTPTTPTLFITAGQVTANNLTFNAPRVAAVDVNEFFLVWRESSNLYFCFASVNTGDTVSFSPPALAYGFGSLANPSAYCKPPLCYIVWESIANLSYIPSYVAIDIATRTAIVPVGSDYRLFPTSSNTSFPQQTFPTLAFSTGSVFAFYSSYPLLPLRYHSMSLPSTGFIDTSYSLSGNASGPANFPATPTYINAATMNQSRTSVLVAFIGRNANNDSAIFSSVLDVSPPPVPSPSSPLVAAPSLIVPTPSTPADTPSPSQGVASPLPYPSSPQAIPSPSVAPPVLNSDISPSQSSSGCPLPTPPPFGGFQPSCRNGTWTFQGSVVVESSSNFNVDVAISIEGSLVVNTTLQLQQTLQVAGNFSMAVGSELTLQGSLSTAPVVVTGCADLGGSLTVRLPPASTQQGELPIIESPCVRGTFSSISLVKDDLKACQSLQSSPQYRPTQLSVAFSTVDSCSPIEGFNMGQFIGLIVGLSLALLAIVVVVLLLSVPSLRKRVFPHRDRAFYVFGQSGRDDSYHEMRY